MENFATVLGICRYAVEGKNDLAGREVEKLAQALVKSGNHREAKKLRSLIEQSKTESTLKPNRLLPSSVSLESITPGTTPPFDRESGIPLATIKLPPSDSGSMVFNARVEAVLEGIINEQKHYSELNALGVSPTTSVLLHGKPGTGKTTTAYMIAQRMGLPIVGASLSGLTSSFLGTSSRNLSSLFSFANRYRCVLLLDEFDAIAKIRDDPNELGEIKRVVNTLLQCLDQRRSVGMTIAITNHEHLLDAAIWRRFDSLVAVPLPSVPLRRALLEQYLKPLRFSELEVFALAHLTDGLSGSDIENLCTNIKRRVAMAVEEFTILEISLDYFSGRVDGSSDLAVLFQHSKQEFARWLNARSHSHYSISQAAIAELLGVSQSTVSRWITERSSDGQ